MGSQWRHGRRQEGFPAPHGGYGTAMSAWDVILFIIAAVLVIAGVMALVRRQILWGIVLIIIGLLVGPFGVSVFS
jgi:hypothetical protein